MSILTLKEAGSELTLDVVTAAIVEGKFGSQVKFIDANGDVLFVPESSVERQLDRIGVAEVADISGRRVHFSRSQPSGKNNTIFWNLSKAQDGDIVNAPKNGAPKTNIAGKPFAHQEPDPPKANPTAKTVPGGLDDSAYADRLAAEDGSDDEAYQLTPWGRMVSHYRQCVNEAKSAWGDDTQADALVAAAATLFIGRNQKGI